MKRQNRPRQIPTVLTIAGSDSGGGAGAQADLKTFAAVGVHGTSALTCVTAQNPDQVAAVEPCTAPLLQAQLDAVFDAFAPRVVKTGMLYSKSLVKTVASYLSRRKILLVVDPVMVATSSARLLKSDAMKAVCEQLFPLATLITPNLYEAQVLTGTELRSPEDLRGAARSLQQRFGCAVLVKGGHLQGLQVAVDLFYDGNQELLLSAPFIQGIRTHGTGCTYSAAIAAFLAKDFPLHESVAKAKEFVSQAIAHAQKTGSHDLLNCFWQHQGLE